MTDAGSCFYAVSVMHCRLRPFRHRFRYAIRSLLIDLDELPSLSSRLRLLCIDRPGPMTFRQQDHGPGDGRPLKLWVEDMLVRHGLPADGGRVRLLCCPRILGYAFNPLSIFFCEDRNGRLRALIYQVDNTFGDRHFYVHAVESDASDGPVHHECDKAFYVSPFIGMHATYHFRVSPPDEQLRVLIRQSIPDGDQLVATMTGTRQALTDRALAGLLLFAPLSGFKVIAAIHWQALKLWLKGARYHPRPTVDDNAGDSRIATTTQTHVSQESPTRS